MTILTLRPTPARLAEPPEAPEQYYQASPDRQLTADPARRRRTDFVSDGVRLAGHLYRPPGPSTPNQNPYVDLATAHVLGWLEARLDKPVGA
jgi:hypothetical protein